MATVKSNKRSTKNKKETSIKSKISKYHNSLVKTADTIVEETIASGEEWQNLLAKSLKKGGVIASKQNDLVFDTLEMMRDQYVQGTKRFFNLINFKPNKKSTKAKSNAKKSIAAISTNAKTAVKKAVTSSTTVAKKVKKVATPVISKKAPKVIVKTEVVITPVKLTEVKGIGPKFEEILINKGIISVEKLANTSPSALKEILIEAGKRYAMIDPNDWISQAKNLTK